MAVYNIKNKIRKAKQRLKSLEKTNPRMAEKLKGKLAYMEGIKN